MFGRHVFTKDKHSNTGFDMLGIHKDTNSEYNPNGFIRGGIHKGTDDIYDPNCFNMGGIHKDTNDTYNRDGFDKHDIHRDTDNEYDLSGFNMHIIHKDTSDIYNPDGFDVYGIRKDTNDKYDSDGFDVFGRHKDTGLTKKDYKTIDWLPNKNDLIKVYNELSKEKSFTGTASGAVISSNVIKDFAKDIIDGKINNNNNNNNKKIEYNKRLSEYEELLSKGKKGDNKIRLRNYVDDIKYALFGVDQFDEEFKLGEVTPLEVDENKFNINGLDLNGYDKDGFNINGLDENGLDKNGKNINGIEGSWHLEKPNAKRRYNAKGFDKYGFDKDGYNKGGFDEYSFDKDGYNKYNRHRDGDYKKQSGKELRPKGLRSKELDFVVGPTVKKLSVLLSQLYTKNNSKNLKMTQSNCYKNYTIQNK